MIDSKLLAQTLHGVQVSAVKNPGVLMDVTMNADGDLGRESFMVEVKNGKQEVRSTRFFQAADVQRHRTCMTDLLQLFISGRVTDSIYAEAGLDFKLPWQTLATSNFAQGKSTMWSAFLRLAFNALRFFLLLRFVWRVRWQFWCSAGASSAAWWIRCSSTA